MLEIKEKFNRKKNRVNGKTWNWKLHVWIQDFFLFFMVLFFLWKSEEMTWFIFYSITSQSCSKKIFFLHNLNLKGITYKKKH